MLPWVGPVAGMHGQAEAIAPGPLQLGRDLAVTSFIHADVRVFPARRVEHVAAWVEDNSLASSEVAQA